MKNALLLFMTTLCAIVSASGNKDLPTQQVPGPDTFIYRQVGGVALKAYVFNPSKTGGKHPAILLFHGGAWKLGDASWTFQRAKEFSDKGIVAISIDYRLANDGRSPIDGVEDACAAFAWARDNSGTLKINTKMIAGYGVSAGGHLVAAAALLPSVAGKQIEQRSRPNALVLFSPALNMAHDKYFNIIMEGHRNPAAYSPSAYISSKLPPTLIIQGQEDNIVLTADAIAFRDAAVKAGHTCSLYVYPGVGHLLTRNLKVQYKDFDGDPIAQTDAHKKEDAFLDSLGYFKK